MIVEWRLRKFDVVEADGEPRNRLLWAKYFKTGDLCKEFAKTDSDSPLTWIGLSALGENFTYDLKRIEVTL